MKFSATKFKRINDYLQESLQHLEANNPNFFAELLPANQHWRLFPAFRASVAYLDIETTGLDAYHSTITTIAMYDGKAIHYYIKNENLDDFIDDIKRYPVIVTYNGKCFDVPFIEAFFGITVDAVNIDLRYILKSLGFSGGLKSCEKQLGLSRGELEGVDGYFAVLLWKEFTKTGDCKALETLLAYNIEDVVNLERLMTTAYNLKVQATPFSERQLLPEPPLPNIPFKADLPTIDRIKEKHYSHFSNRFFR